MIQPEPTPEPAPENLSVTILETPEEQEEWLPIAERSEWADMHQCPWWSEPLRAYGIKTRILALFRGGDIVGGGLFRIIPTLIPGVTTAQCLDGPIFMDWDPSYADAFAAGLRQLARRTRGLQVTISGCPRAEVQDQLVAALRKNPGSVRATPDHAHALIRFHDRDWNEIRRTFNRRTRTALRKASENGLVVKQLRSDEEIRHAHGAWLASASRKAFGGVRPWKTIQPVLRHCVDRSLGYVLASYSGGEMLASIFFTAFRRFGRCIYAGHYDQARSLYGTHILQATAMQICMEREFEGYDLDVVSHYYATEPDGVDQYKLGFGTTPAPRLPRITWERNPALCRVLRWLRDRTLVRNVRRVLRRRMVR